MANQQSAKGNPAHKRMGNPNLKARRARSYAKGQERKEVRRKAQENAHKRNLALIAEGKLSPWQLARYTERVTRLLNG